MAATYTKLLYFSKEPTSNRESSIVDANDERQATSASLFSEEAIEQDPEGI